MQEDLGGVLGWGLQLLKCVYCRWLYSILFLKVVNSIIISMNANSNKGGGQGAKGGTSEGVFIKVSRSPKVSFMDDI